MNTFSRIIIGNIILFPLFASAMEDVREIEHNEPQEELSKIHLTERAGQSPLHEAVIVGDLTQVRRLFSDDAFKADIYGITPLHDAAFRGERKIVVFLANKNVALDSFDIYSKTPLHYAIQEGHKGIVRFLVNKGASCSAIGRFFVSPLCLARTLHNDAIIKILEEKCQDETIERAFGQTNLHRAVIWGDETTVRSLLDAGTNPDCANSAGTTPVHISALFGFIEILVLLIEDGASIDLLDEDRRNGLHYASIAGQGQIVEELIDSGIQVDLSDAAGLAAYDYAQKAGHREIMNILKENGPVREAVSFMQKIPGERLQRALRHFSERHESDMTSVHKAAYQGDMPTLMKLRLAENVSLLNSPDQFGMTPLHWAIVGGHYDTVLYLVQQGATIEVLFEFNVTPIQLACALGEEEIETYLRSVGAKENEEPRLEQLLYYAILGDIDTLRNYYTSLKQNDDLEDLLWGSEEEQILSMCADEDSSDDEMIPRQDLSSGVRNDKSYSGTPDQLVSGPLAAAAFWGYDDIVEFLLSKQLTNLTKSIALCAAARNGHINVIKMLVHVGASVNPSSVELSKFYREKGVRLEAPLMGAIKSGSTDCVAFLLAVGAQFLTAEELQLVTEFVSLEILEILLQYGKEAGIIQPNNAFNQALSKGFIDRRQDSLLGIQLLTRYGLMIDDELSAQIFRSKNKEHIEHLLSSGILPNEQVIREIVIDGGIELVKLLLAAGIQPNNNMFYYAVISGSKELVKLLLAKGAPVFFYGYLEMEWAAGEASLEVWDILLQAREEGNFIGKMSDAVNGKLFKRCIESDDLSGIQMLIRHNVTLPSLHSSCPTPVCRAVLSGKKEMVELLLDHGAQVNERAILEFEKYHVFRKYEGFSPLEIALSEKNDEIARVLIANGADLTTTIILNMIRDKQVSDCVLRDIFVAGAKNYYSGKTMLHAATQLCDLQIVRELLSCGADPNALDAYGNTSLDIARNSSNPYIAYIIEVLKPLTTQNEQEVEAVQSVQSQHSKAKGSLKKKWSLFKKNT